MIQCLLAIQYGGGIAAWPVDTFVKTSSGLGERGTRLQKEAKGGNWK